MGQQAVSDPSGGTARRALFNSNQRNYDWHGAPVFAVGASPDGARFASAGGHNLVKLWDAEKGTELRDDKLPVTVRVKSWWKNSDPSFRAPMQQNDAPLTTNGRTPQRSAITSASVNGLGSLSRLLMLSSTMVSPEV